MAEDRFDLVHETPRQAGGGGGRGCVFMVCVACLVDDEYPDVWNFFAVSGQGWGVGGGCTIIG